MGVEIAMPRSPVPTPGYVRLAVYGDGDVAAEAELLVDDGVVRIRRVAVAPGYDGLEERVLEEVEQAAVERGFLVEDDRMQANKLGTGWYFEGVSDLIEAVLGTEPDFRHVEEDEDDRPGPRSREFWGRRVGWQSDSHYVVEVPVEKVQFMEGNQWNFGHAAAVLHLIETGQRPVFDVPAARLYRIDADDVERTERYEEEGQLSYQVGMAEPWQPAEAGTFYVQLVDGNHRALAALAAGESSIYVAVGENHRDDVYDEEWVRDEDPDRR